MELDLKKRVARTLSFVPQNRRFRTLKLKGLSQLLGAARSRFFGRSPVTGDCGQNFLRIDMLA